MYMVSIYPKGHNEKLSENFWSSEFEDTWEDESNHFYMLGGGLVYVLQGFRKEFNVPVYITSGYRTADTNIRIGGKKRSYHTLGLAADFYTSGVPIETVYSYVMEQATEVPYGFGTIIGGVGYYPKRNFVHVDIRRRENDLVVVWGEEMETALIKPEYIK